MERIAARPATTAATAVAAIPAAATAAAVPTAAAKVPTAAIVPGAADTAAARISAAAAVQRAAGTKGGDRECSEFRPEYEFQYGDARAVYQYTARSDVASAAADAPHRGTAAAPP